MIYSKVSVEVLPKNPRARQLWDRWRNVWMMAWERQRRLQDKLAYLQDLEKVKNFNWDDWRRRVIDNRIQQLSACLTFLCFPSVHEVYESQEIPRDRSVPQNG